MKRILSYGFVGLIIGYLFFGRVGGQYIPVSDLFATPDNLLTELQYYLEGIEEVRNNVLLSGAVGAGLGLVVSIKDKVF